MDCELIGLYKAKRKRALRKHVPSEQEDALSLEVQTGAVLGTSKGLERHLGLRVDQDLQCNLWSLEFAHAESSHSGHVSTSAVASDGDTVGINSASRRILVEPTKGCLDFVKLSRILCSKNASVSSRCVRKKRCRDLPCAQARGGTRWRRPERHLPPPRCGRTSRTQADYPQSILHREYR